MSRRSLSRGWWVAGVVLSGLLAGDASAVPPRGCSECVAVAGEAPAVPPSVAVLGAWDAARARAWARGDPRLLRPLYAPGSRAGRQDRAMLQAWTSRGLTVHGLETQVLSVRELDRSATTWTLRVTDRLVGGVATGPGVRLPLPRDRATTRTVRLVLVGSHWRVAGVRARR